jgi:flavin-dependent dehydrogenase
MGRVGTRHVIVVGGGPAGAAAAIALGRAGERPLLLERDAAATEKVCGEFLAEDALHRLAALGLDVLALGGVPIRRAIFAAGRGQAQLRLPFAACGLPRAVLDAALLDAARAAGAEIRTGTPVIGAERARAGWRLRLREGEVTARAPILATGKHELRGLRRAARGGAIGVKLVLRGASPEAAILLLACRGGYAGLQPRPGGANLCAALDPRAPGVAEAARSAEAFRAHVAGGSALAERVLRDLQPDWVRPMTVAGVPYGHVERGGGVFRAGDQAAVIPSFCGDGVAMALASGEAAAAALLRGLPPEACQKAWAHRIGGGMRLARWVSALTERAPRLLVAGVALAPSVALWTARRTRLGHVRRDGT